MELHLKTFVKNELFKDEPLPEITNRRFFPMKSDIRSHMYRASVKLRFAKMDQQELSLRVENWKKDYPNDNFFFRPYGNRNIETHDPVDCYNVDNNDDDDGELTVGALYTDQKLLFIHQSKYQQRLFEKYGNHITLLDATYKTTKYSIPLFFIAVKTNVKYMVVASFALQEETKSSITEALTVISSWNPKWSPKCFMVDNCREEIDSIEAVFPDSKVLLCDFHREQAWERWLATSSNGMRNMKSSALVLLRAISDSESEEAFNINVTALKNSEIWKLDQSVRFRSWIEKTWLPFYKQWVKAYRVGLLEIVVDTNNGIERQNKDFKHEYLKRYKDNSLSGMIKVLVEQFLPDKYKSYVQENVSSSNQYRKYSLDVPTWLHDRPKSFVSKVVERLKMSSNINNEDIINNAEDENGNPVDFYVHRKLNKYLVSFRRDDMRLCECVDWKRNQVPCKHILAVMRFKNKTWEDFPLEYRLSPFFTLDFDCFIKQNSSQIEQHENQVDDSQDAENEVSEMQAFCQLRKRAYFKSSIKTVCRYDLKQIQDLLYYVHDESILGNIEEKLKQISTILKEAAPKDAGFILEPPLKKPLLQQDRNNDLESLPRPKARNIKSSCRIGRAAEAARVASNIVVEPPSSKVCNRIIEEQVDVDDTSIYINDKNESTSFIQLEGATEITSDYIASELNADHTLNEVNTDHTSTHVNIDHTTTLTTTTPTAESTTDPHGNVEHRKHGENSKSISNESKEKSSCPDLVITKIVNKNKNIKRKERQLKFSEVECNKISTGKMLTDESIDIAQKLLKQQFSDVDGFADIALSEQNGFEIVCKDRSFIQILHTGNCHWVCAYNVDKNREENSEVYVADNLSHGIISDSVKTKLCSMLYCKAPSIKVTLQAVQQQKNSVDCGVFAIAFATALAFGHNLRNVLFDDSTMRTHLIECIKKEQMTMFPTNAGKRQKQCRLKILAPLKLHCYCRMPYITGHPMAQCGNCFEWYHKNCAKIPNRIFLNKELEYYCKECTALIKKSKK